MESNKWNRLFFIFKKLEKEKNNSLNITLEFELKKVTGSTFVTCRYGCHFFMGFHIPVTQIFLKDLF